MLSTNQILAWSLAGCGLLFQTTLHAQQTNEAAKRAEVRKQEQIEKQTRAMRDEVRLGRSVQSHVRVVVRLKSGYRLSGVVKNGRLVERVDGLHFVSAQQSTTGAGVRIWYHDDTNSYIFIPFSNIKAYTVGERLTSGQVHAIEKELIKEARVAEMQRREKVAKAKAKKAAEMADAERQADATKANGAPEAPKPVQPTPEEAQLLSLLEEFPPEAGWGPEKAAELQRRKVAVGAYPNAKEKRFLENLTRWQQALQVRGRLKVQGAEIGTSSGTATPTTGTESSKKKGRSRRGSRRAARTPAAPKY